MTDAIGIDIGGTKIALGLVSAEGRLSEAGRIENREARDFGELLDRIVETVRALSDSPALADGAAGIGVSTCELVGRDGEIWSATEIPWTRADLVGALEPFGRVVLEADVRASALAEARLGAGAPFSSFVHVTVGTGISSCLVRDGVPDPGAHGFAQLIGSAPLTVPARGGGLEPPVALEDIAGGPALVRHYAERTTATVHSAEEVLARVAAGDAVAAAVVDEAATMLGSLVALLVNVLDPEAVVIGGGLGSIRRALLGDHRSVAPGSHLARAVALAADHPGEARLGRRADRRRAGGPSTEGGGVAVSGRMEGKVVVVTGAGLGIGRAVCERLAEEGAEVVPTSRTRAHLDETVEAVTRITGREPLAVVMDVGDGESIEAAIDEIGASLQRIDVVCNNAGIDLPRAPQVDDVTDDEWESVFRINVAGMFKVCRSALRFMPDGGSIVNIGSINSFIAWPNNTPYTASKGAVLQFTRALSLDVAARRIRVNCVCPGIIDTPLTRSFVELADDPDALVAEYDAVAPLGRMGTSREVANCVLFLASEEASFVTGASLLVDGGTTVTT